MKLSVLVKEQSQAKGLGKVNKNTFKGIRPKEYVQVSEDNCI